MLVKDVTLLFREKEVLVGNCHSRGDWTKYLDTMQLSHTVSGLLEYKRRVADKVIVIRTEDNRAIMVGTNQLTVLPLSKAQPIVFNKKVTKTATRFSAGQEPDPEC